MIGLSWGSVRDILGLERNHARLSSVSMFVHYLLIRIEKLDLQLAFSEASLYDVLQYNAYYRQIWTDGFAIVTHSSFQTSKGDRYRFSILYAV